MEKIKSLIQRIPASSLNLGHNEMIFATPDSLEEFQLGYRIDSGGNSLISNEKGQWQDSWYVIAHDEMGDPVIMDTALPGNPIFSAPHGRGEWELSLIADSFISFLQIVYDLEELTVGRTSPAEFETNPIPERTKKAFLAKIAANNKKAEVWFWAMWVEEDVSLTLKKYSF